MPAAGDCGCGRSANSLVVHVPGTDPLPLAGYPDCAELYEGAPRVVVVVDRMGVNERLFAGWDLGMAAVYSAQYNWAPLETINAYRLCAAAVETVPA